MKKTQEFSGKDIDSAIKNACFELNLSKSELTYDIISTGASGIFGIVGRKNAKIRVFLPVINGKSEQKSYDSEIQSIVDEAFGVKAAAKDPVKDKQKQSIDTKSQEAGKQETEKQETEKQETEKQETEKQETEKQETEKNKQKEFKAFKKLKEKVIKSEIKDGDGNKENEVKGHEVVDVTQESIELGKEAIQKMINLITNDAVVTCKTDRDRLILEVSGGNSGILIGRKGQTLEAMQFLVDKIVNRKSEVRVRVKVDIEGYMEARKTNLVQLASKMADKVKKTGRPAIINQMSGQDRRIIHLALKEDPRVNTQSKGDGYYRRLIILPKRIGSFKEKITRQQ